MDTKHTFWLVSEGEVVAWVFLLGSVGLASQSHVQTYSIPELAIQCPSTSLRNPKQNNLPPLIENIKASQLHFPSEKCINAADADIKTLIKYREPTPFWRYAMTFIQTLRWKWQICTQDVSWNVSGMFEDEQHLSSFRKYCGISFV